VLGLAAAASINAASSTAVFQVSATVSASCNVSATNVAFGAITPAATGVAQATGTITSTCTKTTPYTLSINKGVAPTYATRTMAGTGGNTDLLNYNLYTSNAYTTIFGDATESTQTVGGTGTGVAQATTVYGQLSLNQYIKPDAYTDNLIVTLSY
ncbi:MAG: spore coat protein, partial [Sphingobacteriaceae bacterium]|nr:spore coat protein [Sphingobacteriaceae bacterium]